MRDMMKGFSREKVLKLPRSIYELKYLNVFSTIECEKRVRIGCRVLNNSHALSLVAIACKSNIAHANSPTCRGPSEQDYRRYVKKATQNSCRKSVK